MASIMARVALRRCRLRPAPNKALRSISAGWLIACGLEWQQRPLPSAGRHAASPFKVSCIAHQDDGNVLRPAGRQLGRRHRSRRRRCCRHRRPRELAPFFHEVNGCSCATACPALSIKGKHRRAAGNGQPWSACSISAGIGQVLIGRDLVGQISGDQVSDDQVFGYQVFGDQVSGGQFLGGQALGGW